MAIYHFVQKKKKMNRESCESLACGKHALKKNDPISYNVMLLIKY